MVQQTQRIETPNLKIPLMAPHTAESASPQPPLKARRMLTIKSNMRNEDTRLLRLPRELRDVIYWYALVEPNKWDKRHCPDCPFHDLDAPAETPPFAQRFDLTSPRDASPKAWARCDELCVRRKGLGLLRVCKQLYDEADPIFWEENTLCFDGGEVVIAMTRSMPASAKRKVRKLSLMQLGTGGPGGGSRRFFWCLSELSALTHLEISGVYLELTAVSSLYLPRLKELRLVSLDHLNIWTGQSGSIYMALSERFRWAQCRIPDSGEDVAAIDFDLHVPDRCQVCRLNSAQLEEAATAWKMVCNDLMLPWFELAQATPKLREATHAEHSPYIVRVRLADDRLYPVRVWGLPLLTAEARRKRRLRATMLERCTSKTWSGGRTAIGSSEDVDEDDEVLESGCKTLKYHRGGNRNAEEVRETEEEQWKETKKLREKHEAARKKSESKKTDKARAQADQELANERKAALKRLARRRD